MANVGRGGAASTAPLAYEGADAITDVTIPPGGGDVWLELSSPQDLQQPFDRWPAQFVVIDSLELVSP